MRRFKSGDIVRSTTTKTRYRLGELLGEGGFGSVYRAAQLNRYNQVTKEVCLKVTGDQQSWHRESYFGELLADNRRVIQLLDSFPMPPQPGRSQMLYGLVFELARHGTIDDYLTRTGKRWNSTRTRREIIALLKVLDQLHGASATHRDLTPGNIFVCHNGILKLGDFGIAVHSLADKPRTVDAFNENFVTRGFQEARHRHWLAVDDVFQMGQLMAMLLHGDASHPLDAWDVRRLDCDPGLKAIIRRSIGPRRKRHPDASELLADLRGTQQPKPRLRSLEGKRVLFNGRLSFKPGEATLMVIEAGGEVVGEPSDLVDVVVQGRGRRDQLRRPSSRALRRMLRRVETSGDLDLIGEAEFRRLVKPTL